MFKFKLPIYFDDIFILCHLKLRHILYLYSISLIYVWGIIWANCWQYKLKRCSNKECCKQCRYVMFKGTMTKWPVQKLTQGTTQKLLQHHDGRNRHLENIYFLFFGFFFLAHLSTKWAIVTGLCPSSCVVRRASSVNFFT